MTTESHFLEEYRFGPFCVDVRRRRLSREGETIALPSRVFDLLVCLLRHQAEVVDKDALTRAGWADAFVTDDSLIHGISVLRKALGDDTSNPRFIVTLPRRGYQFIGTVQENGANPPASPTAAPPTSPTAAPPAESVVAARTVSGWPRWTRVAAGAAGIVVALVALSTIWSRDNAGRGPASQEIIRLAQLPPDGTVFVSAGALSSEGRQMAFAARDRASGKTHIWVRNLGTANASMIEGTEGGTKPFWSPRADALGYFVGNNLMTVPLNGDRPRRLTSAIVGPSGGSWGTNDVILFADTSRGVSAIAAKGGSPVSVTTIDPRFEGVHAWPQFLPDGNRFLYSVLAKDVAKRGTWLGSVNPDEPGRLLLQGVPGGVYAPSGHILYVRENTLTAAAFNPTTLQIVGEPRIVARSIPNPQLPAVDPVSASQTALSFRALSSPFQLTWFDRSGRRLRNVPTPISFHNPALSSDERVLLAAGSAADDPGLWLVDLDRSVSTRLEPDGIGPVISRDNAQVAYISGGGIEIRARRLSGQADERVLFRDDHRKTVQDWSPDGRYLVFSRMDPTTGLDLWLLPLTESDKPFPLLATSANERQASISPDGRWIAYTSDESSALEVYVQEFPTLGSKRTLSAGGGVGPLWARGGDELFYLSTDRHLMSVELGAQGPRAPGRPVPLFIPPLAGDVWQARNYYNVAADGKTFLFNAVDDPENIPITVMVNWLTELPSDSR